MEKYTEFSDPVTGINPYVRVTKYKILLFPVLFFKLILNAVLCMPVFLYKYFWSGIFTPLANPIPKKLKKTGGTYICTYTSIFDVNNLYRIFGSPSIYAVQDRKILKIDRYNVQTYTSIENLHRAVQSQNTVILLMGGGMTNGEIYINTTEIEDVPEIDGFISLKYTPSTSYNINLFNTWIYPQFTSRAASFLYYLVFYITMSGSTPVCKITVANTLADLSDKTKIEISGSHNSTTTKKFFKAFALINK
ncbi:hypothetical protein NERG_01417 [Nematocida ausubeli]|uniref:Uncharacterized protein n=1 Tax=Nematocida ausubeli (strain ATCC PRA-371 / ERTm2) TaxID=1913371 RepID=H8ZCH4_NEMA1|nr:hypothetical protein NERG_01417 [Nematocida ausubeli]